MGITRRMVVWLCVGVPLTALASIVDLAAPFYLVYYLILLSLYIFEFWHMPRHLVAERIAPRQFEVGRDSLITVFIQNHSHTPVWIRVIDAPPADFWQRQASYFVNCRGLYEATISYAVRPEKPGPARFGPCRLELRSKLRLATKIIYLDLPTDSYVHPNFNGWHNYRQTALRRQYGLPRSDRLPAGCWRATPKTGQMLKTLDQKRRPLMIAVDTGRHMDISLTDVPQTYLDKSLQSALALAQVAISAGDMVGFLLYDGEVHTAVKPARGSGQMFRIMHTAMAATARQTGSDVRPMAEYVSSLGGRAQLYVFSKLETAAEVEPAARERSANPGGLGVTLAGQADGMDALQNLGQRHDIVLASILADVERDSPGWAAAAYREQIRDIRGNVECMIARPETMIPLVVKRYREKK